MYHGDRSRKETLVNYGSALPSALDNRPLTLRSSRIAFTGDVCFGDAGPVRTDQTSGRGHRQIIRPTGLLDRRSRSNPFRPGWDDLLHQIRLRTENDERVLVTTLTKRMSEDLAEHYTEAGVKCAYLHSKITTLDRIRILRDLRKGRV